MAITTADGWFAAARDPKFIRKTVTVTAVAAQPISMFDVAGNPGAGSLTIGNTTTGIVPTDATAGFPDLKTFAGGATGYLATAGLKVSAIGGCILYDRLWHAGSVLMNALATTSFASQPAITQRLPGGTGFGNLEIILEINVAVSATATTVSVNYTNELGVAGRTTGATATLSGFISRRVIFMPLQTGDKGVQKIDSITIGGTVATTGSVNVILARRLAEFDVRVVNGLDLQSWDTLGAPQMFDTSALWPVFIPDSAATGAPSLTFTTING